jgi:hypothetical protein
MTQATMYWLVLVVQVGSMHAPSLGHWAWGQCLFTGMLEFFLLMEWLLLMWFMKLRSHVPKSMNQVKQFSFFGLANIDSLLSLQATLVL